MSGARITVDGLWRCLCPSIDAAAFTRAISSPYRPQLSSRHPSRPRTGAGPRVTDKLLHTTARRLQDDGKQHGDDPFAVIYDAETQKKSSSSSSKQDKIEDGANFQQNPVATSALPVTSVGSQDGPTAPNTLHNGREVARRPVRVKMPTQDPLPINVERIFGMEEPYTKVPPGITTENVMEAIQYIRDKGRPKWRAITATLVKHLLANGVAPNTFIYETMLMAHALPSGSADAVRSLLREMQLKKIPWSSTAYHSALRVLAIHPDYLLRNDVIREMKNRWIEISPEGHRNIAIGLLRDEQYELALEKLQEMIKDGIVVEPWVFDIFIYVFGQLDFLDDAFRIAQHKLDSGHDVPPSIWYFLLDVCSKGQNYDAATYIWNRTVEQGIVNPSDGVALNMLNMAAAYGDTGLSTLIIQYLAARGTKLSRVHYEAVADAYSAQGNMEKAIEVYCIMHTAGAELKHSSTGSLSQTLRRDPALIDDAVQAMSGLKAKYQIHISLFNAVLGEMVKSTLHAPDVAFDNGLALYRRIREFVPDGPSWETFRSLLWQCTKPEVARFLAGEMVHFNIRQNLVIMELMFKVHVNHNGPSHRTKGYFFKIAPHLKKDYPQGSKRWQNFMDLSVTLVRKLIGEKDPEAWRILDICQRNGLEATKIKALREEVEAGKIEMQEEASRSETTGRETGWQGWGDTPATGL